MNEIIETTYNGKTQYWLATIEEDVFSLPELMNGCGTFDTYKITKYVDKLRTDWKWKAVTFTPITENTFDAYYSRAYHRGYEADKDPFIVRSKILPELTVKLHNHTYKMGCVSVEGYSRRTTITPGQTKWINEMFGQQLSDAYTEELVNYLVEKAIERMKNKVAEKLCRMRTESNEFEQFIFSR